MDLVEQVTALKAALDALTGRMNALESAISNGIPADVSKHFRKVDYVLDMYFGNEVIKFNEAEATAAAAAAAVAATSASGAAASVAGS